MIVMINADNTESYKIIIFIINLRAINY